MIGKAGRLSVVLAYGIYIAHAISIPHLSGIAGCSATLFIYSHFIA